VAVRILQLYMEREHGFSSILPWVVARMNDPVGSSVSNFNHTRLPTRDPSDSISTARVARICPRKNSRASRTLAKLGPIAFFLSF
jgi:hypothetical protein